MIGFSVRSRRSTATPIVGCAAAGLLAATSAFSAILPNPPDTDGAVGPNHVVSVVNPEFVIQDRTGVDISRVPHDKFWTNGVPNVSLTPLVGFPFSPRVLYDPYDNRWIITAATDILLPKSSLLIAVSQSDDPTAGWNRFQFDGDTNDLLWVDSPNVGFNKDWIAVHCNMRSRTNLFESSGRLYIFNKQNLYSNGPVSPQVLNLTSSQLSMVPATTYDPALGVLYLIHFAPGSLMPRISSITGPVGSPQFNLNIATAVVSDTWSLLPPTLTDIAPQAGTTNKIAASGEKLWNAVYRNGSLWFAHTIYLPFISPNRSAVQWWQVSPGGAVAQRGRVDDSTGKRFYAVPSLSVNKDNDVLVGFSCFASNIFASAAYSFHAASDPPGYTQAPRIFKPGEGPYYRPDAFGLNAWGDHSSTVVDPVNDTDLWTIQEYADAPSNVWSTWWAKVTPPDINDVRLTHAPVPSSVELGNNIVYTLTVSNLGPLNANSVQLTDVLPTGADFVSVAAGAASCVETNDIVVCDLGVLPPGGSASVTVTAVAVQSGLLVNLAAAYGVETDPNLLNNIASATSCVPIVSVPNVWINEFHYNDSTLIDIGEGVEVAGPAGTDLAGMSLVFYDGTAGTVYGTTVLAGVIDDEGAGYGALWFSRPGIEDGAIVPGILGKGDGIALALPCAGIIEFLSYEGAFTATQGPAMGLVPTDVGLYEPDSTPAGYAIQRRGVGLAPEHFTWRGPGPGSPGNLNAGQYLQPPVYADLTVSSSVAPPSVTPGNNVTYSITVSNQGPDPATSVQVTNTLASTESFVSAYSSAGSCQHSNGIVTCALAGPLAMGGNATITVVATKLESGRDTNTTAASSFENDTNEIDNIALAYPCAILVNPPEVWINEFHYEDTTLGDLNEGVEIAGPAGTDLAGLTLLLANGGDGLVYDEIPLSGSIDNEQNGFGALWFSMELQNGAVIPNLIGDGDGIAIVPPCESLIQFLSYEGQFTASGGQLAGVLSADIPVYEPASTPTGLSLQVTGTGVQASDFGWVAPTTASPGNLNVGQFIPVDADGDGIPSNWEFVYFGGPTNAVAGIDSDLDGSSNLEEYIADTDPTNPASFFSITAISNDSPVSIVFPTSSSRVYGVEFATNLLPQGAWVNLQTNIPGSGGPLIVFDTNPAPRRAYRSKVSLP